MNKETSTYLDCMRFLAAFAVLLGHVNAFMVGSILPHIAHCAFEAVGLFFALSGFVIGYVADSKEKNLRSYAINRAARLYSVVVPCLAITFLIDEFGRYHFPSYFASAGSSFDEVLRLLFSLTFLNWSWILPHPIIAGSDGPFWSLCFEVQCYLVFGAAFFLRGIRRMLTTAVLCCIAGPTLMILPLWLSGFATYRICRDVRIRPALGQAMFCTAVLLWAGFELCLWHFKIHAGFGAPRRVVFVVFYVSGLIFCLSIIGFQAGGFRLRRIAPVASWLAGRSFTLYLLHLPVAFLVCGLLPKGWPDGLRWFAIIAITLAIVFVVAAFTEQRKNLWRRGIEALVGAVERLFANRTTARLLD